MTNGSSVRLYVCRLVTTWRAAIRIVVKTLAGTGDLAQHDRLERPDDRAVGTGDLADDLGLVERAAVGQGRVGVQDLERGRGVEALADPGLDELAGQDRLAERGLLPLASSGTIPDTSPGRSIPVGAPKPYWWAQ